MVPPALRLLALLCVLAVPGEAAPTVSLDEVAEVELTSTRPRARPDAEAERRCTSDGRACIAAASYDADVCRLIEEAAREEALDPGFFARLLWRESLFDASAVSPAGAQGIAQFMPGTWATWGKDYSGDGRADVMDPTDAIGSQADLMCALYDQAGTALADGTATGDRLQLALAGYNAGFGNVTKYGGIPPFTETQRYVKKILALVATYSLAPSAIDAGGGPAVSDDGTYRVPTDGSGRLDPSTLCQIPWASSGMVLRCDAEKAFEKLNTAYRDRFGTDLVISSAYRDYATQVLLKQQKGDMAATPGRSNHGWGLAVDIGGLGGEGSERHQWLRANAPAYGWQHPSWARSTGSLPEPWHWEFVGTP